MDHTILKSHVEKPEKFKGSDFRHWQQKMLFYLTSSHVSYVLTDSEPVDPYMVDGQNVPTEAQMADYERAASQWNHNEYNYRNYILNALDDSLYDIYSTFETAREIWKSLEKKYMTQQAEELQIIVHEMKVESIGINSNFLVGSIIEKLPQSWKNFNLYLKHLTDDMSFEQLVLKIRVEEDNKMIEKAYAYSIEPNANLDGKKDYTQQMNNNFKKVYHCWVCGKLGHKAKDCRHKKEHGGGTSRGNSNQANHVQFSKEFAGVIESFLTTNVVDWWYDTGCTKHICNSRRMFVSYQKLNELEPMFMGNRTSSKIERKGKVILKMTSGKDLVLSNVLYVPNITKNLIYGPILSNKGFKLVTESNKFVITKGCVYVGKGYFDEGLFKLSVVTDDNVINNNNAGAPHSLWGEACLAANTIVQIPLPKRTKLGPKTVDCVYFGLAKSSAGYRFLVYKSNVEDISNNTIIESAEADFFENIFPYKDKEKQISNLRKRVMNDQLSQDETDNNFEVPRENVESKRSKRAKVTKYFGLDYMTYIVNEEPQTYKAVMESSEAPYWKKAIRVK
nr:DNA polymerase zeta catalytic subunit-like [Tanacetum cinerariifolium]